MVRRIIRRPNGEKIKIINNPCGFESDRGRIKYLEALFVFVEGSRITI